MNKNIARTSAFHNMRCKHGKVKPLRGCRYCKFAEGDGELGHCTLDYPDEENDYELEEE